MELLTLGFTTRSFLLINILYQNREPLSRKKRKELYLCLKQH